MSHFNISNTCIVDSRRPGRHLPPTNRFADSFDDEDEEKRRLVEEQEEQERILLEQNGEAEESTATRSKHESETDDTKAEYGTARKKAKRPTLTHVTLLGPKGLIRIRSELMKESAIDTSPSQECKRRCRSRSPRYRSRRDDKKRPKKQK